MCYINSHLDDCGVGFVGDKPSDLHLEIYPDADLASDKRDYKSTNGGLLALVGPNTFYPLEPKYNRQSCQSQSSTEAELLSANASLQELGMPAMDFWEAVLGRPVKLIMYEDNQACAKIIQSGKFDKMRHVSRAHGVRLSFMHDCFKRGIFELKDCNTNAMKGDIFTKFFSNPFKWQHDCQTHWNPLVQGGQ